MGRLAGVSVLALLSALTLTACAESNATDYATQACDHVERSLTLYGKAASNPDPAGASSERTEALKELRNALPLASLAASDSGRWQALEFTIGEFTRVDEGHLIHALSEQCQAALPGQSGSSYPSGG